MKSIAQSETSHNIKLNSLKTMGGTRPKKLKMRSSSDMNLSHSTHSINIKKNTNDNKELDCLKLKVTQTDNNGCPISPGKEKKVIKFIYIYNIYNTQILICRLDYIHRFYYKEFFSCIRILLYVFINL